MLLIYLNSIDEHVEYLESLGLDCSGLVEISFNWRAGCHGAFVQMACLTESDLEGLYLSIDEQSIKWQSSNGVISIEGNQNLQVRIQYPHRELVEFELDEDEPDLLRAAVRRYFDSTR